MRDSKRGFPALFLVSSLLSAVALGTLPFVAFAQNQKNTARIDQLRQKAWNEGTVQVIVHFDVPDIEQLTADSARFLGGDMTPEMTKDSTVADTNLIKAVEYSAWKLVTELQGTHFEEVTRFEYIPFIALRVSPNALAVLEASADVLGIEENTPRRLIKPIKESGETVKGSAPATGTEDMVDPLLSSSAVLVGAKAMWDAGYTGAGWYVAILDTGIRRSHEFFSGKTIVEACRALGSDGIGPAGDCPNGLAVQDGNGSAVHYASSYDGYDHGTHVAGIAAGSHGSLAGIAKGANIIAVKVFSRFSGSDVSAWDSDIISGLIYVYSLRGSYKIAAANLSLGSDAYSFYCDSYGYKAVIDLLRSAGIATVIATGNEYYCDYIAAPACTSTAVAVGSSTKSDQKSDFSNWAAFMQKLFAPGEQIKSSTGSSNSSYESWDGTSMATPHVTGAWALLKQAYPTADVTTLLNSLRTTGKAIYGSCDGYSMAIPRIQIFNAFNSMNVSHLIIQAGANGTTNPAPGTHVYILDSVVQVTATPNQNASFTGWTGDASGTANPITVKMGRDKTIKANFRVNPKITIQPSAWGTTIPAPGAYYYALNADVQVTATPATYACFTGWTGDASGTDNPVTVKMTRDKTIKANFHYIYAPVASGERILNRSFSQAEYIDTLSWQNNSGNAGLTIAIYKIYTVSGSTLTLLAEVTADQTQYSRRNAGSGTNQYAISAVTSGGREGAPALVKVE